jgi:CRISPR/Cas system Type II protein with McrA/HNH and RuvC-like nuclease domain
VALTKSTPKKKPGVMEKRRHQIFMRRSYQAYRDLEKRCAELDPAKAAAKKKAKKPLLSFTLDQLRELIKVSINEGVWCPYLGQIEKLTVRNFSVDHVMPVSRGGSPDSFDNLVVCSRSGNFAKGEMTGEEFAKLMQLIQDWPRESMMDVIGRLKAGAAVKRLRFLGRKVSE